MQQWSDSGKSVDIQLFHETMGHSNEEYLKLTAKSRGIELKGELQPCESCHVTKARKKDVAKTSESRSNTPGQRLLVDQSSVKAPSFGGRNYWLLALDQSSSCAWSYFLKHKNDQNPQLLQLIWHINSLGLKVEFIRMDNSGENKALAKEVNESKDLSYITIEFTPPNTPQYNGQAERHFQTFWGRTRALLNGA